MKRVRGVRCDFFTIKNLQNKIDLKTVFDKNISLPMQNEFNTSTDYNSSQTKKLPVLLSLAFS